MLFLAAVLPGCGDENTTVVGGDVGIPHPRGNDVVVQVRHVGGLRLAEQAFSDLPSATLVGNGVLVFEGAQIEIFPPPMLPSLWSVDVGDDGIQAALQRAVEAGLLSSPPDYGRPPLAYATTTVVEIHAQHQSYVHEIYALHGGDMGAPGLSPEQLERRRQVAEFTSMLTLPEIEVGRPVPEPDRYRAEAIAVRASAVSPGEEQDDAPGGISPEVVEWPLAGVGLAAASDCMVIDGAEAEELYVTLAEASTATRFHQGGEVFSLEIRPLLPNEESCGDVQRT